MQIVIIPEITISCKDSEKLLEKTGCNIAEIIAEAFHDTDNYFTVKDTNCVLNLTTLFDVHDCRNGYFDIFVETNDIALLVNLDKDIETQKTIMSYLHKFIDQLNLKLNKFIIPLNNLDSVIFNNKNQKFYVELGCATPKFTTLNCELEQDINDICWV